MDEIQEVVKGYSQIIKSFQEQSIDKKSKQLEMIKKLSQVKTQDLTTDLFGDYSECWILLYTILSDYYTRDKLPPFFSNKSEKLFFQKKIVKDYYPNLKKASKDELKSDLIDQIEMEIKCRSETESLKTNEIKLLNKEENLKALQKEIQKLPKPINEIEEEVDLNEIYDSYQELIDRYNDVKITLYKSNIRMLEAKEENVQSQKEILKFKINKYDALNHEDLNEDYLNISYFLKTLKEISENAQIEIKKRGEIVDSLNDESKELFNAIEAFHKEIIANLSGFSDCTEKQRAIKEQILNDIESKRAVLNIQSLEESADENQETISKLINDLPEEFEHHYTIDFFIQFFKTEKEAKYIEDYEIAKDNENQAKLDLEIADDQYKYFELKKKNEMEKYENELKDAEKKKELALKKYSQTANSKEKWEVAMKDIAKAENEIKRINDFISISTRSLEAEEAFHEALVSRASAQLKLAQLKREEIEIILYNLKLARSDHSGESDQEIQSRQIDEFEIDTRLHYVTKLQYNLNEEIQKNDEIRQRAQETIKAFQLALEAAENEKNAADLALTSTDSFDSIEDLIKIPCVNEKREYKENTYIAAKSLYCKLDVLKDKAYYIKEKIDKLFLEKDIPRKSLLVSKFLIFLQFIYKRDHTILKNIKNPIEYIRRSEYKSFFDSFGNKFDKSETFECLLDLNSTTRKNFLNFFFQNSQDLSESNIASKNYDSIYHSLAGEANKLIELLEFPNDPHNEMWAELFLILIYQDYNFPVNFSVKEVKNLNEIEFEKYCFNINLYHSLCEDRIVDFDHVKSIDGDSLAFYFNLGIIFENKALASRLLNTYLSLLFQLKEYESIFDYTYFLPSKLFNGNESLEAISEVATSFSPDHNFLDPLKRRKEYGLINEILLKIKDKILAKDSNDYLRALKWLELDKKNKEAILQLATEKTYSLALEKRFLQARETFNIFKDFCDENEYEFWNTFLPIDSSNELEIISKEKIEQSFKKLLLWTAYLKSENQVALGYEYLLDEEFNRPEEAKQKTDQLINFLIKFITDNFKSLKKQDIEKSYK